MKQIIRTENAGVFYGEVKERSGSEATLANVRGLWYWDGANELLDLATNGLNDRKPVNLR